MEIEDLKCCGNCDSFYNSECFHKELKTTKLDGTWTGTYTKEKYPVERGAYEICPRWEIKKELKER